MIFSSGGLRGVVSWLVCSPPDCAEFKMTDSKWLKGKYNGNGFEFDKMGKLFKLTKFELAGSNCNAET